MALWPVMLVAGLGSSLASPCWDWRWTSLAGAWVSRDRGPVGVPGEESL